MSETGRITEAEFLAWLRQEALTSPVAHEFLTLVERHALSLPEAAMRMAQHLSAANRDLLGRLTDEVMRNPRPLILQAKERG